MTHLTKIEAKGLFGATNPPRPNRDSGNDHPFMAQQPEAPFAVGVDMTPDQARSLRIAGWPQYEWPAVSNLSPRTRGKHY